MSEQNRMIEDVGLANLQFPIRVLSRRESKGQATVATIAVNARILQDFEARWIDRFIQVLHRHSATIGTATLQQQAIDYLQALDARSVEVCYEYPFFIEKTTPVSEERCLVRYRCAYAVRLSDPQGRPRVIFRIEIPVITTYPGSVPDRPGGLFGQLSRLYLEILSDRDIFPEDLVAMVDRLALSPLYSFLTGEDQIHIIEKVHTEQKTSVVLVDDIKKELARNRDNQWFSVRCTNFGMLHSYSTMIGLEKSSWMPFSGFEGGDI
jgi:GTP cyclohydrolase I